MKWSVQVEGESNAQKGEGEKFEFFVCDQSVLQESLKIREISLPAARVLPTARVIANDKRCGDNFDTIMVSGKIQTGKAARDYVLAGSTKTGFILQYNFTVKDNSK